MEMHKQTHSPSDTSSDLTYFLSANAEERHGRAPCGQLAKLFLMLDQQHDVMKDACRRRLLCALIGRDSSYYVLEYGAGTDHQIAS